MELSLPYFYGTQPVVCQYSAASVRAFAQHAIQHLMDSAIEVVVLTSRCLAAAAEHLTNCTQLLHSKYVIAFNFYCGRSYICVSGYH